MMTELEKAVQTQIVNIQKKTGMTLEELAALAKKSGLSKHGELRDMFKDKLGLGHGDANALVHAIFESDGTRAAPASLRARRGREARALPLGVLMGRGTVVSREISGPLRPIPARREGRPLQSRCGVRCFTDTSPESTRQTDRCRRS